MDAFSTDSTVRSWGRVTKATHLVARPSFRDQLPGLLNGRPADLSVLAIGLGRSYGESGLNADGALIGTAGVDRLIDFDASTGILHAEAGVSLAQVLEFAVPRGFFLPVTPGTKFVTLAGAVANDVHGKNHHRAGTFGRHVRGIGLLRSDGSRHWLTPEDASGLFAATVGGLGLTGLITDVAVALRPIKASRLDAEMIPFGHVREFFGLTRDSLADREYTVAWIDCLKGGDALGRGIFTRADHASGGPLSVEPSAGPRMPLDLPGFALNRLSIAAFNWLYFHKLRLSAGRTSMSYNGFFYPLDGIADWNRMYGGRGFYQYQSVVPPTAAEEATVEMLKQIGRAGQGSFLVVLKTFGALVSPGMLSFPIEGTTLALDFPNKGASTLALLDRLDAVVKEAGGRLYPAKDGRLPATMFRQGHRRLAEFTGHVDPAFSSSFWRRMMERE
jgi:L-gulonolactone oxidase